VSNLQVLDLGVRDDEGKQDLLEAVVGALVRDGRVLLVHRSHWKTYAGYRARQCGQGRYVWLTPHGLGILVDHHGTRRISEKHAGMILDAPPGVDICPGMRLELAGEGCVPA
jgi:hypothetical protein